jgi:hypothetical protein
MMSMRRIETVNSIWHFDEERAQFRRVPRDAEAVFALPDEWEPYYGLEVDDDTGAFTVLLDPDGTRRFRSWLAEADTEQPDATAELPLLPAKD